MNKKADVESNPCNCQCVGKLKQKRNDTNKIKALTSGTPTEIYYDVESKSSSLTQVHDPEKFKQVLEEITTSIQSLCKSFNKAFKKCGQGVGDTTNSEQLTCFSCGRALADNASCLKDSDITTNFKSPIKLNKSQTSKTKCIYLEPVTLAVPLTFHISSEPKEKTVCTEVIIEVFGEPAYVNKKKSQKEQIRSLTYEMEEDEPIRTATVSAYKDRPRNIIDCQCFMDESQQYAEFTHQNKSTNTDGIGKPISSAISVGKDTYYSCDSFEQMRPKTMFRSIASYTKEDFDKIAAEFGTAWLEQKKFDYASKTQTSPMIAKTVQTDSQVTQGRSKSLPIWLSEDKMSQTNPKDFALGKVASRSLDGLPVACTPVLVEKSSETLKRSDDTEGKGNRVVVIGDVTAPPKSLASPRSNGVEEQPTVNLTESYHSVLSAKKDEDSKVMDKHIEGAAPATVDKKYVASIPAELSKQISEQSHAQPQQVDKLTEKAPFGLTPQLLQPQTPEPTEKSLTPLTQSHQLHMEDEQVDKIAEELPAEIVTQAPQAPQVGKPTEEVDEPIEKSLTELPTQSSQPQVEDKQVDKTAEKPPSALPVQPPQPQAATKQVDESTEKSAAGPLAQPLQSQSAEPTEKSLTELESQLSQPQIDEAAEKPPGALPDQPPQPQVETKQVDESAEELDTQPPQPQVEDKQMDKLTEESPADVQQPIKEKETPAPIAKPEAEPKLGGTTQETEKRIEDGTQTDVALDRGHQKRKSLRNDILGNLRCLIDPAYAADHSSYTEADKKIVEDDLRKILIKNYTPNDEDKSITEDITYLFAHMSESRQIDVPKDTEPKTAQRATLDNVRFILDPKSEVTPRVHFSKKDQEKMLEILTKLVHPPSTSVDELSDTERNNLTEEFRQLLYSQDTETDDETL